MTSHNSTYFSITFFFLKFLQSSLMTAVSHEWKNWRYTEQIIKHLLYYKIIKHISSRINILF